VFSCVIFTFQYEVVIKGADDFAGNVVRGVFQEVNYFFITDLLHVHLFRPWSMDTVEMKNIFWDTSKL
jgi:hypothetical protein